MYKFYAYAFFTVTLGLFTLVIADSNLFFQGNTPLYAVFLLILIYGSFIIAVLFSYFFKFRSEKVFVRTFTSIFKRINFASKYVSWVLNTLFVFWVFFLIFLASWMSLKYVLFFVVGNYQKQIVEIYQALKNQKNDNSCGASYILQTDLHGDISELQKVYYEDATYKFFQNNSKVYTKNLTHYQARLVFREAGAKYITYPVYRYKLSVCLIGNAESCFRIRSGPTDTDYISGSGQDDTTLTFDIPKNEVISGIDLKGYSLSGIQGYIFAGKVKTDLSSYPFIVFPSATKQTSDYYYYQPEKIDTEQELSDKGQSNQEIVYDSDLQGGRGMIFNLLNNGQESNVQIEIMITDSGEVTSLIKQKYAGE